MERILLFRPSCLSSNDGKRQCLYDCVQRREVSNDCASFASDSNTYHVARRNLGDAIMQFQQGSRGAIPNFSALFGKSNIKVLTKHLGYKKPLRAITHMKPTQHVFQCDDLGGKVNVLEYFKRSKSLIAATFHTSQSFQQNTQTAPSSIPICPLSILDLQPKRTTSQRRSVPSSLESHSAGSSMTVKPRTCCDLLVIPLQ